jgi:hypothetical protein
VPRTSLPPRDEAPPSGAAHRRLPADRWAALAAAHARRADELTAAHRARRTTGEPHAVEDFLFTYYPTRPSALRRWHPGAGVALAPAPEGPAPHAGWHWYGRAPDGGVALDARADLLDRGDTVAFVHRLLTATAARPPFTGCFGLHEWAMVSRQAEHRHPLQLQPGCLHATMDLYKQSGGSVGVACRRRDVTPAGVPVGRRQTSR